MSGTMTFGVFPLVRKLSRPFVVLLSRFPVTPNQITTASLLAGLGASACFIQNNYPTRLIGAVLFTFCYLLDNCDGEIARLKHLNTRFGDYYDTFIDWIVHTSLFLALGYGNYQLSANPVWLWFGILAGAGSTINYLLGLFTDSRAEAVTRPETPVMNPRGMDLFVLVFRELARADFCFIVLILTLIEHEWILLPLAAVGAQAYWLMLLKETSNKFHV